MESIVECSALSKCYDGKTRALVDVSLTAKKGEVVTLVGRNGAGKTTFVRIFTTQLLPTSGLATICGLDVVKEPEAVRRRIALMPQEVNVFGMINPREYVTYLSRLEGMTKREASDRASDALKKVDLVALAEKPCRYLSGGERRRVVAASVLASKAQILFLDEMTAGLDPVVRRLVWKAVRQAANEGKTILLTTHLMEEAEMLSDRIVVLNKGSAIFTGTPSEIKAILPAKARVIIQGNHADVFTSFGEVKNFGDREILYVDDLSLVGRVLEEAEKLGVRAEASPVTLEDSIVRLIGELD